MVREMPMIDKQLTSQLVSKTKKSMQLTINIFNLLAVADIINKLIVIRA